MAQEIAEWINSEMFKTCLVLRAIFFECRKRSRIASVLHFFAFRLVHALNQSSEKLKKSHTNLSTFLANGKIASFYFDIGLAPCDIFPFRRDLFPFDFTTVNRIAPNANRTPVPWPTGDNLGGNPRNLDLVC